jgi:hypothetical protein
LILDLHLLAQLLFDAATSSAAARWLGHDARASACAGAADNSDDRSPNRKPTCPSPHRPVGAPRGGNRRMFRPSHVLKTSLREQA